jgi:hypothetical protein
VTLGRLRVHHRPTTHHGGTTIDETVDRLYGLPLAEFTQARNEVASTLRRAGQRDEAARAKALRKPTAAAAAVNRLVREHRREVEQFLHAAAVLRDAQFSGKADLAAATKREHEELEGLTRIGGEAVRQTLLAAAVDDDAARQLLEARLERELEPRGFGTLITHAPSIAVKPPAATAAHVKRARPESTKTATPIRPAPPERRKPDDAAARARLQDAKAALSAVETDERRARHRLEQAQHQLEKARAAVIRAQRDLDRLHDHPLAQPS